MRAISDDEREDARMQEKERHMAVADADGTDATDAELLEEARAIVAGETMLIATGAHLAAALRALDAATKPVALPTSADSTPKCASCGGPLEESIMRGEYFCFANGKCPQFGKEQSLPTPTPAGDSCPKGDPDCETDDDGSCHDACEAPTLTQPGSRAFHNLNNALQLLIGYDLLDAEVQAAARESLRERLESVVLDLGALQQLLDRQERVLAELREEGVRMAQYIVRLEEGESKRVQEVIALREQVDAATRLTESLYEATNADVGLAAVRHSRVLRLRAALCPPKTVTDINTPRLAAGGIK